MNNSKKKTTKRTPKKTSVTRRQPDLGGKIMFFFDKLVDTINNSATAIEILTELGVESIGELNDLTRLRREFNKTDEGKLYYLIQSIKQKRDNRFMAYMNKSKYLNQQEKDINAHINQLAIEYANEELNLIKKSAALQYGFFKKKDHIKERRSKINFEELIKNKTTEMKKNDSGLKILIHERRKQFFLWEQEEYYFLKAVRKIQKLSEFHCSNDQLNIEISRIIGSTSNYNNQLFIENQT